jgi:cytoskeleton protein RodZ
MSVQAGGDTRCGIGTRLRAGRERKSLTVLQAAEKLHVDAKVLESLEAEDFEALGAPVYVRGHLRHYAELVGEQADELQSLYSNSVRVTPPDLTRIAKAAVPSETRRLVVPATVVVLVFAIAGGVWWIVTLSKGQQPKPLQAASAASPSADSTSTSASTPQQPLSPTPLAVGIRPEPQAEEGGRDAAAPAGSHRAAPSPAITQPIPPRKAADSVPPAAAAERASGRDAQLTLRFSAESWAEVYDSNGERLFYDIGSADSVRTFKATPPLRVVLGNAPGVAVEVNGRAADLATLTHPDGSAQFVVGRAGRVSQPAP